MADNTFTGRHTNAAVPERARCVLNGTVRG